MQTKTICLMAFLSTLIATNEAFAGSCWTCRSEGEFGDCRDPFTVNLTSIDKLPGINISPCASGWCGKLIEGDDIGNIATERMCVQNPPDDVEERCAETQWKDRKVYMCFCQDDLCNGAQKNVLAKSAFIALAAIMLRNLFAHV